MVLLCIMAQLGSRVPAESALLRIPDRVFSRVSNKDCMETNSSTFMVEMEEASFILSNAGATSLVIIDELGRGTSVTEGAAICYAVNVWICMYFGCKYLVPIGVRTFTSSF